MESLDRLFDVFREERRRYALYALDRADGPVGVEELAERVRRYEGEGAVGPGDDLAEVVLSLEHHHLPKAAQAEYIEYDRESREIRITGTPVEFEIVLTVSGAMEMPADGLNVDTDRPSIDELLTQLPLRGSGD